MVETLEELIEIRRKLLDSSILNDNYLDDYKEIYTGIYPDKTHFIYELLQNSEDMNATKVVFELYCDKLIFKHNGTKRDFTLDDIDAITRRNDDNTKRNDETTIGKYGFGFKAVYAYTDSPEIHSGNYHFRIINCMLPEIIPELENEKEIDCNKNAEKWTIFIFPFNHKKKTSKEAFTEIAGGLEKLNSYSLLFLKYLKEIEYHIMENSECFEIEAGIGRVKFNNTGNNIVEIVGERISGDINYSYWLHFIKTIKFTDDKGYPKEGTIGVAYKLERGKGENNFSIQPLMKSKAFIYFPAEKEETGLRFLINAPFASTVARDCVRETPKNHELISYVANLVVESLSKIKELGFMNNDFFNVLPNKNDFYFESKQIIKKHDMYLPILEAVIKAFKENEYLPTIDENYVRSNDALRGTMAVFSEILNQEFLRQVADNDSKWVKNAISGSSADYFFDTIHIKKFGYKDFSDLFKNDRIDIYLNDLVADIKENDSFVEDVKDWFVKFYSACNKTFNELGWRDKSDFLSNLKKRKIFLSEDFEILNSSNIYFNIGNENNRNNIKYVNHLIADKNSSVEIIKSNASFFDSYLEIKVYNSELELKNAIARYEALEDFDINDNEYFCYIITACLKNEYLSLYKDKKIFIYEKDNKFKLAKASDLVLSEEYGNDNSEFLSRIYSKPCLWSGYLDKLGIKDEKTRKIFDLFLNFVRNCNIIEDLQVERRKAEYHPMFSEWLDSRGTHKGSGENEDYYIPELDKKMEYAGFNKYLWEFLKAQNSNVWAKARFSPNRSRGELKENISSLFYELQNIAWLPNKLGNLFKPSEISIQDLADDFVYDENAPLLIALGLKETSEKVKEVNDYLQKTGQIAVDADSFAEFTEWKKKEEDRKRKAETKKKHNEYSNTVEIFEAETKEENCFKDEEEEYFSIAETTGVVKNPERRQQKIEENFNDLKELKSEAKYSYRKVQESSEDEKINLKGWYNGKCQMCGKQIITYDHKPYFEAINIVSTSHLPEELVNTEQLCWNSLCLCPNCAAEYKHCSKNIVSFYEQIRETEVKKNDDSNIELTLNIAGETRIIKFCHKHFLALKTAFKLIDKQYNNENDL